MSASREKKQRQSANAPWISSRSQKEQQAEIKRKRNMKIYIAIGVVAVILVAALLIWDSGIFQRKTAVATIDGQEVIAAQVAYYYYNNDIIVYAQYYANMGLSSYYPYLASESPSEQTITEDDAETLGIDEEYVDKTYHEYFLDTAINSLIQEYALLAAAEEAGYTLSEDGQATVESEMKSIDSSRESYLTSYGVNLSRNGYLQLIYGDCMTASLYRTCLENYQLAYEFYNSDDFYTLADYSDEELTAYYEENQDTLDTLCYYYMTFDGTAESTTDEDGNTVDPTDEETEAAMAAAKEEAEAMQEQVDGDLSAVEANEDFTKAEGVMSNISSSSIGYDWLVDADRQPGDTTVIEGTSSYYLVVFGDRYLDTSKTANFRDIFIKAVNEDDPDTEDDESADDPTEEAFDAAEETAQALLDQWVADGSSEEDFAALAKEHSADSTSNTNGGLYTLIYSGYMNDAVNDWLFDESRASGDTGLVLDEESTTKGWYILYYVEDNMPVWENTARINIWLDNLLDSAEVTRLDRLDSLFD